MQGKRQEYLRNSGEMQEDMNAQDGQGKVISLHLETTENKRA